MKALAATHKIESLFESCNYITVFNDATGEAAGRIYKAKQGYLATNLNTGKQLGVRTIQHGEAFILLNRGGFKMEDNREVARYDLYKVNDFGQRIVIDKFESKPRADSAKRSWEYREPGYSYKIIPVYREENLQPTLF